MEKNEFILTGDETNSGKEICITIKSNLSAEEKNMILSTVLLYDLELHPMILNRVEEEVIKTSIIGLNSTNLIECEKIRISRNDYIDMILDIEKSNMFLREFFDLPLQISEFFDPNPYM